MKCFSTVFLLLILTACSSHYRTNSDLSFSGRHPRDIPPITIGDLAVGNEHLDYLGWVTATVSKPMPFSPKPTKEQANLVLADLAQQKQADAVTFVEYKYGMASNTLTARGQAVRYKETVRNQQLAKKANEDALRQQAYVVPYTTARPTGQSRSPVAVSAASAPKSRPAVVSSQSRPSEGKTFTENELDLMRSNVRYLEQQAIKLNRKDLEYAAKTLRDLLSGKTH